MLILFVHAWKNRLLHHYISQRNPLLILLQSTENKFRLNWSYQRNSVWCTKSIGRVTKYLWKCVNLLGLQWPIETGCFWLFNLYPKRSYTQRTRFVNLAKLYQLWVVISLFRLILKTLIYKFMTFVIVNVSVNKIPLSNRWIIVIMSYLAIICI